MIGYPLNDLPVLTEVCETPTPTTLKTELKGIKSKPRSVIHTPASITFVRNRMFYARAALNAQGRVKFGLRHIREFKRSPSSFFLFLIL
jgi:hypothetical protein